MGDTVPSVSPSAKLSVAQIMGRVADADRDKAAHLDGYTSFRRYQLENKRFNTKAEMFVKLMFRSPSTKKFSVVSEKGPRAVRQKVFQRALDSEVEASRDERHVKVTPENYSFRLIGMDSDRARPAYLLEATPKTDNRFLFKGRVWIDANDFVVTRIEGQPAKSPSFFIRSASFVHTLKKVGAFWLDEEDVSHANALVFGDTTLQIRYMDYQVSTRRE